MCETRKMVVIYKGILLAYANDIIVILRDSQYEIEGSEKKCIKSSKRMGIYINDSKIKYGYEYAK